MPIIYKGRIIRPEMEKLDYSISPRATSMIAYYDSLPGIECSPELLAKFKEWDEVVEGKDYRVERTALGGRSVKSAEGIPVGYEDYYLLTAVPIHTDAVGEEDEMWQELIHKVEQHQKRQTEYPDVINELKSQYRLIKK